MHLTKCDLRKLRKDITEEIFLLHDEQQKEIFIGEFHCCWKANSIQIRDKKIKLSSKEFAALFLLINNMNKVVTFETLFYYVWGKVEIYNIHKSVNKLISRIRLKLNMYSDTNLGTCIQSIYGVGYKFEMPIRELEKMNRKH